MSVGIPTARRCGRVSDAKKEKASISRPEVCWPLTVAPLQVLHRRGPSPSRARGHLESFSLRNGKATSKMSDCQPVTIDNVSRESVRNPIILGVEMRRAELMGPDIFSEVLLLITGAAIVMVLVTALWFAVS